MTWFNAEKEKPPKGVEVLCKVEGKPFAVYHVLKWEGIWLYFDEGVQGWFGLNDAWKVLQWQLIEK